MLYFKNDALISKGLSDILGDDVKFLPKPMQHMSQA